MTVNSSQNSGIQSCPRQTVLPLKGEFDFESTLSFLGARAIPLVEQVLPGVYRRSLWLDDKAIVLTIIHSPSTGRRGNLRIKTTGGFRPNEVRAAVVRMFDLDRDLRPFLSLTKKYPPLNSIVRRRCGLRLPIYLDPFEGIVRAILGQQISLRAARTITGRLVQKFGEPAPMLDEQTLRMFPRASILSEASDLDLRSIGVTGRRAKTILDISRAIHSGVFRIADLKTLEPASVHSHFLSFTGIGPWTASYLQMRVLGDADAFPRMDLGILKMLNRMHKSRKFLTPTQVEGFSECWRPWRAYVTLHLWTELGALLA